MSVFNKIKKPLIFLVLAGLVVGYYIYLTHRKVTPEDQIPESSVASEVLNRDLKLNYPATPKSVVTYYGDIITIIYKESITEAELKGLAEKLCGLYDTELLAYNSDLDTYIEKLKTEMDTYKEAGMVVADVVVENGYGIEYKTSEGKEYAFVDVKIVIRKGKVVSPIYEEFSLRKDENGRWKIVTWYKTDESKME